MTNTRKKELRELINKSNYSELLEIVNEVLEEEQEKYDNLLECQQESERGYRLSDNIEALENLANTLEELESYVEDLNNVAGLKIYG